MTEIRLPYPHPGQQAVRQQAQRFNWLAAGRRWRKTTLGMSIIVERAIDGQRWLWGAPTFDQVRICWNEAKHGVGTAAHFTQSRMTAEFPTGGIIVFRSLDDPDNARGHTADGVIIDEAEKVKPVAWYEVIRPMLMDTGGDAWCMGTPMGRNWFWKEHAATLDRDDSMGWQIPTKGCYIDDERGLVRKPHLLENPDVPWAEIVHLFETLPRRTFEQEVLAQFLEGQGSVFRNIAACCILEPSTPDAHQGHEIVLGVDWGKTNDYTVVSVGCRDCRQEVQLDRFHGISYHLARQRLAALVERWDAYDVLAESNAMGEPVIDEMQYQGLPVRGFQTTAASKPPLIENLALALERSEVQFIADPVGTAELEAYEMKVSANTGRPTYSAPDGVHDDTVIARALMCKEILARGELMVII